MSNDSSPEPKEVEAAASFFLETGNLCFVTGSISNTGFTASISFNSPEYRSKLGSLTLALRNATLTFHVPNDGANWHEDVADLVKGASRTIQIKDTTAYKGTSSSGTTAEQSVEAKGGFKVPLLGDLGFTGKIVILPRFSGHPC